MDLADRRRLELEIDELARSKEPNAQILADQAMKALRARNWTQAKKLAARAREAIPKKTELLDYLVDKKLFQTKAAARRALEAGKITVDGVVARKIDMDVSRAKQVLVR